MRIALLGNVFQTKKNAYIKRVLKKLAELQADICIEEGFADFLNRELCVSLNGMDTFKMPHLKADLVISMGGDGTFLTSAAQVGARGIIAGLAAVEGAITRDDDSGRALGQSKQFARHRLKVVSHVDLARDGFTVSGDVDIG